ncbi:MAG: hypothetical protein ABEJ03_02930 [Candidatus Nanohaloarchaea archaeon]
MDLLGKEGEKAAEGIETVIDRLNQLESHINAVDNAVQDLGAEVNNISQNSVTENELAQIMNQPDEEEADAQELKEFFVQLSRNQKGIKRRLEDLEDLESDLVETLKGMQKAIRKAYLRNEKLDSRMEKIENRISSVEDRLDRHGEKLENAEELKEELNQVEKEKEDSAEKSFDERQKDVEDELKDLRSSIKQFADRVEE